MTQQMPNPIELHEAAAQAFRQTLSSVRADQMSAATPCSEWNVQALINHNVLVAGAMQGMFQENNTVDPFAVGGPLPAEGAVAALDAGVAKLIEIVKTPGTLEKELNTPMGPMLGAQVIMLPFMDLLIHKWDLAKATGQNMSLDSGLVEVCFNTLAPQLDNMRAPQFFGPAVAVPETASVQDRLLGATGRQP